MKFDDFVGNNVIKQQLQDLLKKNKLFHAFLLEGEKGLGKKTLAKIISQAAVCANLNDEIPCDTCLGCKKVQKEIHPDVIYPEKTGVLQSYSIETIRKIRADAYILPNEAENKVYVLTDIDNMGSPAQNAFLKVLEEPPKNVIFILTCKSCSNIIPTVRSRVLKYTLKPVSKKEFSEYFSSKIYDNYNLEDFWEFSKGNIGLAIDFATNSELCKSVEIAKKIIINLCLEKEFDMLTVIKQSSEDKKLFLFMLNFLNEKLKEALLLIKTVCFEESSDSAKMLSEKFSAEQILYLLEVLFETKKHVEKNVNMTILSAFLCSNLFKVFNN